VTIVYGFYLLKQVKVVGEIKEMAVDSICFKPFKNKENKWLPLETPDCTAVAIDL